MLSFMGNSGVIAAAGAGALPEYSIDMERDSSQYMSMSSANFGWSDPDTWWVALAVKFESVGSILQTFFSKYAGSGRIIQFNWFNGTVGCQVQDSGGSNVAIFSTTPAFVDTSGFYNFYLEFSKSGQFIRLYESGTEVSYALRTNPTSGGNSVHIGTDAVQYGALDGAGTLDGLLYQATFGEGSLPGAGNVFDGSGNLVDLSSAAGVISVMNVDGGDVTTDAVNANSWTNNNACTASSTIPT